MPHYKALDNSLHFLEEDAFTYLLPAGSVAVSDAEAEALRPVPLPPPLVPISPRQIRLALTRAGLRSAVEAAVAAGSLDLKDWWEFSTAFERQNAQVIAMCEALGVSDSDCDDLWKLGITL